MISVAAATSACFAGGDDVDSDGEWWKMMEFLSAEEKAEDDHEKRWMSTIGNEESSTPNMGSNPTPEPSFNPTPPTNVAPSQAFEGDQEVDLPSNQMETEEHVYCNERGSPNKRGLTSAVWTHYKRQKIDDKWKAICKYCNRQIGGDTKMGTKHLHDHFRTCKYRPIRGPRQSKIKTTPQITSSSGDEFEIESTVTGNFTYKQEISRAELAKMIVLHEYPLSMVEHIGFKKFCSTLQPLFKPISRNTIKADIIKLYDMERMRIAKLLAKIPSRVAITTDMWTASTQNKGYMSLTAHFIDDQWILQSRLIRFLYVPAPHTAENLCHVLVDCLYDWNLDRKISALTVDNCSTNDAMIERVFEKIPTSSFVMKGSLFHMRCCAHILNLIVKEGLSSIESSIQKIRDSVSYWVATPKREEKFEETCRQLNMEYSKKLALDCRTRWNSIYLMITSALPYQHVFDCLSVREREYKCVPSEDDWIMAIEICDKLKVFYSVTELFSGTQYPTANAYFPKICEIRLNLSKWIGSENLTIRNLAADMIVKFDKYWGLINGVMAIGAVLDPRYKMKLLNYFFPLMYGSESEKELRGVRKLLEDLLSEYQDKDVNRRSVSTPYGFSSSSTVTSSNDNQHTEQWQVDYLQFVQETNNEDTIKSELDSYFEEGVLLNKTNPRDFDILGYWKNVGVKYPTLQKIARDFLAIPISTVASESAFSTGGRVLSPHRSRLHPNTVEAMMCTQDWLRSIALGSSKGNISTQCLTILEDMDVDDRASCT